MSLIWTIILLYVCTVLSNSIDRKHIGESRLLTKEEIQEKQIRTCDAFLRMVICVGVMELGVCEGKELEW